jgi:hypothetical protein
MNFFSKTLRQFLLLTAALIFTPIALACSDCEDKVCVGPVCACIPNVGRCPPVIVEPERFSFCNITNDGGLGAKPSCTNCSSIFSGDAGKTDCLARHLGGYVQSGQCVPSECRALNATPYEKLPVMKSQSKVSKLAPYLTNAASVQILELKIPDAKIAKAIASIQKLDGTKYKCTYDLTYSASKSKDHKGIQFNVTKEQCASAQ